MKIKLGFCVKIPDGRIGRVREKQSSGLWKIRVKRFTSNSHQFLYFKEKKLKIIPCPNGWMSVDGYNRYLKITLSKMKKRLKSKKRSRRKSAKKTRKRSKKR